MAREFCGLARDELVASACARFLRASAWNSPGLTFEHS